MTKVLIEVCPLTAAMLDTVAFVIASLPIWLRRSKYEENQQANSQSIVMILGARLGCPTRLLTPDSPFLIKT
jgi:hypothetical protein